MNPFLSQSNKQRLLQTLQKVPLFKDQIPNDEQFAWLQEQMSMIYDYNRSYLETSDLHSFNKDAISLIINILKQRATQPIETVEPPKTDPFVPVEDTALTNLNELVEEQKKRRLLDTQHFPIVDANTVGIIDLEEKKKVTWEDEMPSPIDISRVSNQLMKQRMETLEQKIEEIMGDMQTMKSGIYKDVCVTMGDVVKSVIEES